jgi:hypothetical protein
MHKWLVLVPIAFISCAADRPTRVGLDQVPPGSTCTQSAALDGFVGQPASAALGARMMAAASAPKLRWVAASKPIDRKKDSRLLTVRLDAQNRVLSASCG